MVVNLPWPDSRLHPNARNHWAVRAKAVKQARMEAAILARASGIRKIRAESLEVSLVFSPPDKRRRDLDGLLSAMKASLDGISDVIGVDDSSWGISISRGEVVKGGNVAVTIKCKA